jgi:hypothetical protein
MRPVRRRPAPGEAAPAPSPAQRQAPPAASRQKAAWRETLDSYGGLWTIGIIVAAVVFVGVLVFANNLNAQPSDEPLMGEEIIAPGPPDHVSNEAQWLITPGRPPVNGPHSPTPQAPGVYDAPIPDGSAIHSLEHGIIWITYNPQKVDQQAISELKDFQADHNRDVIVSPRPANNAAIAAGSWDRLLQQESLDREELERFFDTNLNRAPEPGVR